MGIFGEIYGFISKSEAIERISKRSCYGFEISRDFYRRAVDEMLTMDTAQVTMEEVMGL